MKHFARKATTFVYCWPKFMVLYEIHSEKSGWTNMYVHPMYLLVLNKRIQYMECFLDLH